MQHALGLMGSQAIMVGIMLALGIAGIVTLFLAVFLPRRWHLAYRVELSFAVLLVALAVYADYDSAQTYQVYEAGLSGEEAPSGKAAPDAAAAEFDRRITAYAFQWGFVFFDEKGAASRNAVKVEPGEKVLFTLVSNDVIHGFNVPASRITTEFEPGETRRIWIRAPDAPGKYLIQCLNYCGLGHAQMKAWLVVGDGAGEGERPRV
jgi:heme/copper-type cytochrome/quinol oxidase subunit 2